MKTKETNEKQMLTIRYLLAMTVADIDIFLLKESDQVTDKEKLYSKEEIREQLQETMQKVIGTLMQLGFDIDIDLIPKMPDAFRDQFRKF